MELQQLPSPYGPNSPGTPRFPFLGQDPFKQQQSGVASRVPSIKSPSIYELGREKPLRKFKSSRLTGEYEKPWLENIDPRIKYDRILFWTFGLIGIGVGAYLSYTGWVSVADQKVWVLFTASLPNGTNTSCSTAFSSRTTLPMESAQIIGATTSNWMGLEPALSTGRPLTRRTHMLMRRGSILSLHSRRRPLILPTPSYLTDIRST
jgi:hypothetical protein